MLGLAFSAAVAVDQGFTRAWPDVARFAWVLGILFAMAIGFGGILECFHDEDENAEFDDEGDVALRFHHVVYFAVVVCGLTGLAFVIERRSGFGLDRSMLIIAGLGVGLVTWHKPSWFWKQARAQRLRSWIGDTATSAIYFGIAAGLVGFGVMREPHDTLSDLLPVGALQVEHFQGNAQRRLEFVDTATISVSRTGSGGYLIDGGTSLPDLTGLEIDARGVWVDSRFGRIGNRSILQPSLIGGTGVWRGIRWSVDEGDSLQGKSAQISFVIARHESERRVLIYLRARLLADSIITHGFNFVTYELE